MTFLTDEDYSVIFLRRVLHSEIFEEDLSMLQAMEFPAITLVIFCLLKSGRRITLMIFYTLGGIRDIQREN